MKIMAYSSMSELFRYILEKNKVHGTKKASKINKFRKHHNTSDHLEFLEESHLEGKQLPFVVF